MTGGHESAIAAATLTKRSGKTSPGATSASRPAPGP